MPEHPKAEGVPLIYSHTADAGPDQSFLLVGERFGGELTAWGPDPDRGGGREIKPKVHMAMGGWLLATLPESAYDGPIVVWAKNAAGWSDPIVLNAPQAWWCQPEVARPGDTLRVFGRDLSERPDFSRAFVCLTRSGQRIAWLKVVQAGKYQVRVELPKLLEPGAYELRVHAGAGGAFGWGEPLPLTVRGAGDPAPDAVVNLQSGDVQQAVDRIAAAGGGTVNLSEGVYQLNGTLVVPADVRVHGAGRDRTFLVSPSDPAYRLSSVASSAWSQGPTGVYTAGDRMVYKVEFPTAGSWTVWLRYATKMSPYKLPGVSRHMTLALDGGQPVWLDHLPNTGSFGMFKWSSSATIQATAGPHEMVWQNVKGGGIHIDVFVLAKDPSYTPSDNPLPTSDPSTIVIQGEDVIRFESKDGALPGVDRRAAVWLAGDRAAISDLTVRGSRRTNLGIAICSPKHPAWIEGCRVSGVRVSGHEGKWAENRGIRLFHGEGRWAENCGIRLFHADGAMVTNNELWGRAAAHVVRRATVLPGLEPLGLPDPTGRECGSVHPGSQRDAPQVHRRGQRVRLPAGRPRRRPDRAPDPLVLDRPRLGRLELDRREP